ncbi:hypothetical protein CDAR_595811 [Caerostris darwini]|uniref:Uncharacterized protein n=1 Tax=Caerostris darwini TaxID=1538125 RepID=A0AAV4Q9E0_9ARAC|nr:hypothetical protein CDAR_595811 [Caerostris darwini]
MSILGKRCVFPSHLADFRNNHSSLSSYAVIAFTGTNNNKEKMEWQLPGCSLNLLDILGERVMGHLRNNTIKTHHSQLGDTSWAFGPKRPNQNSPTLAETVPV